jgi:CBS domain-containing protein
MRTVYQGDGSSAPPRLDVGPIARGPPGGELGGETDGKETAMLCRDLMRTNVATCTTADPVIRCARLMRDRNIGFLPVLDEEGRLAGIVTDRDLVLRVMAEAASAGGPIRPFLTREVVSCGPGDDLRVAEDRMAAAHVSRLVVLDQARKPVGVISLSDIAQTESRARAGKMLHDITRREAGARALL